MTLESENMLTAVDLFSGCGGLTEGLKQAGFHVLGAVDTDDLAVETYSENHIARESPSLQVQKVWKSDIRDLSPKDMMTELGLAPGQLDLLAGCPPCQGFSTLRTMNGHHDYKEDKTKNDLVFEYVRFARSLHPRAVMMENVPGLRDDDRIIEVLSQLRDIGFNVDPSYPERNVRVLNAADFGVPQRRNRMVLLAARDTSVNFAAACNSRSTVRKAIEDIEERVPSDDPAHYHGERRSEAVMARIKAVPRDGGSLREAGEEHQLDCHKNFDGFKDVYGRLAWDDVSSTITSGCTNPSKGRFIHPEENRALTLREAAVLQTFPYDYYISLRRGKGAAARMIGDALPPRFVKAHAVSLAEKLQDTENFDN